MGPSFSINGWSSTDGVPGAVGVNKYGAGASSALSIPITVLLVALGNGGTAVPDQDITPISDASDADSAWGPGWQLTRMAQAALGAGDVTILGMSPATPGGAAAAALTVTFAGSGWTSPGTYGFRVAGFPMQFEILVGDSPTQIATNFAATVNANPRLPVRVTILAGVATVTAVTPGTSGNTIICFGDATKLPSGATAVISGGTPVTGGGVPLTGGSGTENVTNCLAILLPQRYGRIGIGQNDSTNLGRWKTQLDAQAGALGSGIQFAVAAGNGTLSAATSLGQTTLNDELFQYAWLLNSETPPAEIAAVIAAVRAAAEQADPGACQVYDFMALPNVVGQSQTGDWPNHNTLVSAINNSVTPITSNAQGQALLVRSVTTRSLNGSSPDFATHDTSEAVVPAFILDDLKLDWNTDFGPNNPRVEDDPADGSDPPPGVATPRLWNARVTAKMRRYADGTFGSSSKLPIIEKVDENLPASIFDSIADRIMTNAPAQVAPAQHQIGITVLQVP